jgi:predicted kinase
MCKLIIISGLPGSGKSTLARSMVSSGKATAYFESDMWMLDHHGNYHFDGKRLRECHQKCFDEVEKALKNGETVIQSNTNLQRKFVLPYVDLAKKYQAEIEFIFLSDDFGSIHGVPEKTLVMMRGTRDFFSEDDI